MLTAVALEVTTSAGTPVAGVVAHLQGNNGGLLLFDITNRDGYAVWEVPMPFTGKLKLAGAVQYYEQDVVLNGSNITLRCGPSHADPQDILLPAVVPFRGGSSALPAAPTRDQMCGVRNQFQGISVGDHHLFDPEIGWSADKSFRMEAYAAHRAVGDTHICLSLDMSGLDGLPGLKAVIREAITEGGMVGVLLMCMGDGNAAGEINHDPGALNFQWLMANFNAIVDFMEAGEDLTPYINFGPGFDGVIPAWNPFTRVNDFVRMARARLNRLRWGNGYLNVELAGGFASWSGERNDWATPDGQMVDTILQEFPIDWGPPAAPPSYLLTPDGRDWSPSASNDDRAPWTQIWLMQRMLGSLYRRPASQPPNYDPNPPYSLGGGTPRGRFFYVAWERSTYMWCRQQCDISLVNQQTQVVKDLGAEFY